MFPLQQEIDEIHLEENSQGMGEKDQMKCPRCTYNMEKNHLDSYYCPNCDHDWLIHAFKNEKHGGRIS